MKTVLVVDDDPRMRQLYCDILEEAGYDTLQAHRGETAVLLLKVHTVDLIILDIRMPGIHGLEFLDMLRTMYPHLPIITCSALKDLLNNCGVWDVGSQLVGLFEKQVEADALARSVDEVLGAHSLTDPCWRRSKGSRQQPSRHLGQTRQIRS